MHKLEITVSNKKNDSTGFSTKIDIEEDLGITGIDSIGFAEVYFFETTLDKEKIKEIAEKAFTDPLIQKFTIDEDAYENYDYYVEVKLHEDVTDNVGLIAIEAVEDFLGKKIEGKIRTAKKYYFEGTISKEQIEKISKELLANEVIETFTIGEKK